MSSNIFTRLNPKTTADHAFMARMVDVRFNEYINSKNRDMLMNWLTKKFMIEKGLAPLPPDPRDDELRDRWFDIQMQLVCR